MIYIVLFVFSSLLLIPGLLMEDKQEIYEGNLNVELNLGPGPAVKQMSTGESFSGEKSYKESPEIELEEWMMDPECWKAMGENDTLYDDV
jgi:hypothetical protein